MPEPRTDIKDRVKETGHSLADLCRETGIRYNRLSGIVCGYWSPSAEESDMIDSAISEWGAAGAV